MCARSLVFDTLKKAQISNLWTQSSSLQMKTHTRMLNVKAAEIYLELCGRKIVSISICFFFFFRHSCWHQNHEYYLKHFLSLFPKTILKTFFTNKNSAPKWISRFGSDTGFRFGGHMCWSWRRSSSCRSCCQAQPRPTSNPIRWTRWTVRSLLRWPSYLKVWHIHKEISIGGSVSVQLSLINLFSSQFTANLQNITSACGNLL